MRPVHSSIDKSIYYFIALLHFFGHISLNPQIGCRSLISYSSLKAKITLKTSHNTAQRLKNFGKSQLKGLILYQSVPPETFLAGG